MTPRSLLLTSFASVALLLSTAALAHSSAVETRAQQAQAVLSERYAQLYATLAADDRRQFADAERRWLNSGRWDEQRRCLQARGVTPDAPDAPDLAALCLAEVIEARVRFLSPAHVAVNSDGRPLRR